MFWDSFNKLCQQKGVAPTTVCRKLGISAALSTGWRNGAVPNYANLKKLADYFEVTPESMLGEPEGNISEVIVPEGITADEEQILKVYRSASLKDKALLLSILEKFAQ